MNLSVEDVRKIQWKTNYFLGVSQQSAHPSKMTAIGVLLGIKVAVEPRWKTQELNNLTVAIQGVGNVGINLCHYLHEHGVKLFVSDLRRGKGRGD
jgi:leucine dehydrogenase